MKFLDPTTYNNSLKNLAHRCTDMNMLAVDISVHLMEVVSSVLLPGD
jgi:hypothetical protein